MMGHEYVPGGRPRRALGRSGVRHRLARAADRRAHDLRARRRLRRPRAVSRVLVTGAAGFVGPHALRPLIDGRPRGACPHAPRAARGLRRGDLAPRRPARAAAGARRRARPERACCTSPGAPTHPEMWTTIANAALGRGDAGAGAGLRRRRRSTRGARRHLRRVRVGAAGPLRRAAQPAAARDALRRGQARDADRGRVRGARARDRGGVGADLLPLRPRRAAAPARALGRRRARARRARPHRPAATCARDYLHVADAGAALVALLDSDVRGRGQRRLRRGAAGAHARGGRSPARRAASSCWTSARCRRAPGIRRSWSPT